MTYLFSSSFCFVQSAGHSAPLKPTEESAGRTTGTVAVGGVAGAAPASPPDAVAAAAAAVALSCAERWSKVVKNCLKLVKRPLYGAGPCGAGPAGRREGPKHASDLREDREWEREREPTKHPQRAFRRFGIGGRFGPFWSKWSKPAVAGGPRRSAGLRELVKCSRGQGSNAVRGRMRPRSHCI